MPIQIKSLAKGFTVDYCGGGGVGAKVAYAGTDVFFTGIVPAGYDLNRIVVDCLPALVSLTKLSASEISYAKPKPLTKPKKKNKKQLEMF